MTESAGLRVAATFARSPRLAEAIDKAISDAVAAENARWRALLDLSPPTRPADPYDFAWPPLEVFLRWRCPCGDDELRARQYVMLDGLDLGDRRLPDAVLRTLHETVVNAVEEIRKHQHKSREPARLP
jgi:hypothetical protein